MLESKGIVYVNVTIKREYCSALMASRTFSRYIRFEVVNFDKEELRLETGTRIESLMLTIVPWDRGSPRNFIKRNLETLIDIPKDEIEKMEIVGHHGDLPTPPTFQEVLEHGNFLQGTVTPVESQQGLIAFSTNIGSGSVHWIQRGETLDLTMKSGVNDPVMMKILTSSTSKDEVEKDIKRFLKNIYGRRVSL